MNLMKRYSMVVPAELQRSLETVGYRIHEANYNNQYKQSIQIINTNNQNNLQS